MKLMSVPVAPTLEVGYFLLYWRNSFNHNVSMHFVRIARSHVRHNNPILRTGSKFRIFPCHT